MHMSNALCMLINLHSQLRAPSSASASSSYVLWSAFLGISFGSFGCELWTGWGLGLSSLGYICFCCSPLLPALCRFMRHLSCESLYLSYFPGYAAAPMIFHFSMLARDKLSDSECINA